MNPVYLAGKAKTPEELVRRLHLFWGHPNLNDLKRRLTEAGYGETHLKAAANFKCEVCDSVKGPPLRALSSVKQPSDFNEVVSADIFYWRGNMVLHFTCALTRYTRAEVVKRRKIERLVEASFLAWYDVAGFPKKLVIDGESALCSDEHMSFLEDIGVDYEVVPPDSH